MIYVVDDDTSMRDSLQMLFEAAGYSVQAYSDGDTFLAELRSERFAPGCVLLDVRLPGSSGLEVNRIVAQQELPIAVIMISAHGDIPMAVAAVREGAFDFVEKPFDPERLIDLVRHAEAKLDDLQKAFSEATELRGRYAALTPREQEVMKLVVEGLPTKVIAARLAISPRTAETHRARVMEKMGARSLAGLIRHDQILSGPGGSSS